MTLLTMVAVTDAPLAQSHVVPETQSTAEEAQANLVLALKGLTLDLQARSNYEGKDAIK